jgi:hypothetical protein
MQRLLLVISTFVFGALAQTTVGADDGIPSQCAGACSTIYSIAYQCANSTGYDYSEDITLVQQYLNCICASANTDAINS